MRAARLGRCATGRAAATEMSYHFLHIRDFLFDARPGVHATELMPEANEMGVTSASCAKSWKVRISWKRI